MSTWNNLFDNQASTANTLVANITKIAPAMVSQKLVDQSVDHTWGGANAYLDAAQNNPYYDYYFSGQDINVTIDHTESSQFSTLPIISLAFQIAQPKLAIYGFWNYTYNAIAYGARSIAARIEIATQYPNYMTNLLQEVAKERGSSTSTAVSNVTLSPDDLNIMNFWGTGTGGNYETGDRLNLYQAHPVFDIIVTYGTQQTSATTLQSSTTNLAQGYAYAESNDPLFVDTNERLVSSDINAGHQIKLVSCEITNMSTQFTTSGEVVCETYDLMVNDISIG